MGFTLRFVLGIALVLAVCPLLESASTWRHIRQALPIEESPETPILNDEASTVNASIKDETIGANNASNKIEDAGRPQAFDGDKPKIDKDLPQAEKKPKTEHSTEKYTRDNKTYVNKTNVNDKEAHVKLGKIVDIKNEASGGLKDSSAVIAENNLHKESQNATKDQQKETAQDFPESEDVTPAGREESARALDLDISKYVSSEFHNKNNVYSLSVSPDTEKYTNLHNDLPKSTTARLPTQQSKQTRFDVELTTPLGDDFDKKYQDIQHGVKQNLEYIDHQFPELDYKYKKTQPENTTNISEILDEIQANETTVSLNYTKFKNITNIDNKDKKKIHKELDVEQGQNLDYASSYNKTQVFDETPKDYKNKISPPHEDERLKSEILSEVLPEHSDAKLITSSTGKPVDSKQIEAEIGHEKIPDILNFKDSTSLTKPPSLNQTENQKSLLSNKIETEVANPVENNLKIKWDFPYGLSTMTTVTSSTTVTPQESGTTKSGQGEEAVYVPYAKNNSINVSKRGSTRYVDTITTTTESSTVKNRPSTMSKSRLALLNKQALASKENKTIEQAVLENQVYPVQIPSPNKDRKEEKTINDTTEKSATSTEATTLSLKLFTMSLVPSSSPSVIQNLTDTSTLTTNNQTSSEVTEWTTYTTNLPESTTVLNVLPLEETTETEIITELPVDGELETTTILQNVTAPVTEIIASTVFQYLTNTEVVTTAATDLLKNNEFTTTTYRIDASTLSNDYTSQAYNISETTFLEETDSTDSGYSDNATASTFEESGSTPIKLTSDYSDYDERSSSGRDFKGNSNDASFSSIDDSYNNLDLNSPSTTTDKSVNRFTTETIAEINKTSPIEAVIVTTSDYRENIIIKQSDSTTTTKRPDEATHELEGKGNQTVSEEEIEDYGDLDHSTLGPRFVQITPEENTSETTSFIVPLNTSVLDTDTTDATTIGDNSELGGDDKVEGTGGPIAAIVISCIGGGCLILLAGLLFIMRKRHKRFNYGQRCTPVSLDAYSVDNVSAYNSMRRKGAMRASKRSYGNPAFDDPTSTSHSLNFAGLAKFASNHEGISTEFEDIPQVTAQTNELPEGCETKNRYANVIPLPETRVFLSAIDGYPNSDYINANYVTGPKSIRGYYIACQAPMQGTVDDFWRMVWEQQSKVILMLTHLFENGTEKCIDYLPPSEVLDCHRLFGDFQVTLKKREVKEKYVISSLQLKNMVSNSWREVTHLWYLGWPEKGVPFEANSLIAFLIEARSYIKQASPAENGKPKETTSDQVSNGGLNSEQSPVIVHCSPGTGRTGTVIACDIAIREFELTRQVDIPKTVYRIRRDRASSVQTKEQYGFIYKVICLYATKLTGGVLDEL